jgi:hypothetical protein
MFQALNDVYVRKDKSIKEEFNTSQRRAALKFVHKGYENMFSHNISLQEQPDSLAFVENMILPV